MSYAIKEKNVDSSYLLTTCITVMPVDTYWMIGGELLGSHNFSGPGNA